MATKKIENFINHFVIVLDASSSMAPISREVVQVADQQIAYWATRSKEMDQETRVTVYTFNEGTAECIFYDKDVLRLPSLKGLYHPSGMTALIDATLKSIEDLEKTPELYGDHAFLVYVLTDGQENASVRKPSELLKVLSNLKDHWTIAAFVPSIQGVHEAKSCGFSKDNIQVWDTSAKGMEEVGRVMKKATDSYMTARASGVRGTRSLFTPDVKAITKKAINKMDKLGPGQFRMIPVNSDSAIAPFVETITGRPYHLGEAYYQLTKPVIVQAQKEVAIFDKKAFSVYIGAEARKLLGLPDFEVRVSPKAHPNYEIFIQSTSVNRKLLEGTKLLLLSKAN